MKKEYGEILDSLDINVYEYEDSYDLEFYTDAGEDFIFTVSKGNFVNDVWDCYTNFDKEEHVYMWLDAKAHGEGGIPDVYDLIEDSEMIEDTLEEVARALLAAEREMESEVA